MPVARPDALPELAAILTAELKGILTGAGRIHEQMMAGAGLEVGLAAVDAARGSPARAPRRKD